MEDTTTEIKEQMGFEAHVKMDKQFLKNIASAILSQDKKFFKELGKKIQSTKSKIKIATEDESVFTVREAAEKIKCSETTVRRLIAEEKIIATKPNKYYLITRSALNDYINQNSNEQ